MVARVALVMTSRRIALGVAVLVAAALLLPVILVICGYERGPSGRLATVAERADTPGGVRAIDWDGSVNFQIFYGLRGNTEYWYHGHVSPTAFERLCAANHRDPGVVFEGSPQEVDGAVKGRVIDGTRFTYPRNKGFHSPGWEGPSGEFYRVWYFPDERLLITRVQKSG